MRLKTELKSAGLSERPNNRLQRPAFRAAAKTEALGTRARPRHKQIPPSGVTPSGTSISLQRAWVCMQVWCADPSRLA
jgi:hypothetical protein